MKRVIAAFVLAAASIAAAGPSIVNYEPAVVTLVGTLRSGQGTDADGKPVLYPVLQLKSPIRVVGDPGDELNKPEEHVSAVQLILTPELMGEYSRLKGRPASATGKLMHSHTAHHYTSVLLQAQKLEAVAEPNNRVQATRETRAPDA